MQDQKHVFLVLRGAEDTCLHRGSCSTCPALRPHAPRTTKAATSVYPISPAYGTGLSKQVANKQLNKGAAAAVSARLSSPLFISSVLAICTHHDFPLLCSDPLMPRVFLTLEGLCLPPRASRSLEIVNDSPVSIAFICKPTSPSPTTSSVGLSHSGHPSNLP